MESRNMYLYIQSIYVCNWTSLSMINLDVGVLLVSQFVVYTDMYTDML